MSSKEDINNDTSYAIENNIYTHGWKRALYQYQAEEIKQCVEKYPDVFTDEKLDDLYKRASKDSVSCTDRMSWCDQYAILMTDYIKPLFQVCEGKANNYTKEMLHEKGLYDDYVPPPKYEGLFNSVVDAFRFRTGHELDIKD